VRKYLVKDQEVRRSRGILHARAWGATWVWGYGLHSDLVKTLIIIIMTLALAS